MRIIPILFLATLFIAGCEKANANDTAGGCEGGSCEEHACHCELKMSKPTYFSGNMCSDEFPVMQGHMMVKLPSGQVVPGVKCLNLKIEHKCGCSSEHQK